MGDNRVYTEKIAAFSRILHQEGLTVSPQETADACRILIELGLEDRSLVKTALRTVYAKSREEQATFDRVFDGFFLSAEAIRAQNTQYRQEMENRSRLAEEELQLNGKPTFPGRSSWPTAP